MSLTKEAGVERRQAPTPARRRRSERYLLAGLLGFAIVAGGAGCNACGAKPDGEEGQRASASECAVLQERMHAMMLEELSARPDASARELPENFDPAALHEEIVSETLTSFETRCVQRMTSRQVRCMNRAESLEAMAACAPEVDLRPESERPSESECARLGEHLEALALDKNASTDLIGDFERELEELEARGYDEFDPRVARLRDAIADERRREAQSIDVVESMVEQTERVCHHSTRRTEVLCQLDATNLLEFAACER